MKWEILQSLCRFNSRPVEICRETGNNCNKNNCPHACEDKNIDISNKYILTCIKRFIEDAMNNRIDQDQLIPVKIPILMAQLHSEILENIK